MTYSVKEIYLTLQGEGLQTGRPAVFLRFAGCNLWSGREVDRADAVCTFCDTDFVGTDGPGGGRFADADALADAVAALWPAEAPPPPLWERGRGEGAGSAGDSLGTGSSSISAPHPLPPPHKGEGESGVPYVVCTGGEPLLQLDAALIAALHGRGFAVGVETNGTIAAPEGLDWICVSPKAGADLVQRMGDELKFVYPQEGLDPAALEGLDFPAFLLQPMDGPDRDANTRAAAAYCLRRPKWRLTLQTHKWIGLK